MSLQPVARPAPNRDVLLGLFESVIRVARPHVASWDDLKMLLLGAAAVAVQTEAQRQGQSLADAAAAMKIDVTTLRRNLPPPPRPESVESRLERDVVRILDQEGRVTMAEIEHLLESSPSLAAARRCRPRATVSDAVVILVNHGYVMRIERDRLPTQYQLNNQRPVLQQKGQSSDDWLDGIGRALSIAFDVALLQAREVTSDGFEARMKEARLGGTDMPVPERERMPWFFARRPSHVSEHVVNERFSAAIRQVIASLEEERGVEDLGELVKLSLALHHSSEGNEP